ncbi:MAG TPA: hypothetical protein VH643_09155 [Gemmataceae bacterium]
MKKLNHQAGLEQELWQVCRDYYREEMNGPKSLKNTTGDVMGAVILYEIRSALLKVEEWYGKKVEGEDYTNTPTRRASVNPHLPM